MADDKNDKRDDTERHGADAFNSTVPKRDTGPDATRTDGSVDKDKLRAQIDRQKEMAREDDEERADEADKRA